MIIEIKENIMKPIVFYFSFSLDSENDDSIMKTFGFAIKDPMPFYKSLNATNFEDIQENFYNTITEDIESRYGVHDWSSGPSDDVDGIGYCTYEVEEENIQKLMNEWHEVFTKTGCICTPIVEVNPDVLSGQDYDIYQNIISR